MNLSNYSNLCNICNYTQLKATKKYYEREHQKQLTKQQQQQKTPTKQTRKIRWLLLVSSLGEEIFAALLSNMYNITCKFMLSWL